MVVITLGARIGRVRGALTAASSVEHTFMMVLEHVGEQEAIVYAQLVRSLVSSLLCAPLRRHRNLTGTGMRDALFMFERAAS